MNAATFVDAAILDIQQDIDSCNYERAHMSTKLLLARYPRSPYANALRALVVNARGNYQEAVNLAIRARDLLFQIDANSIDDSTLKTLQTMFKKLERLDLLTECYEYVCAKPPQKMERLIELFKCHVRQFNFDKQQLIALKLYILYKTEFFLVWAACIKLLQPTFKRWSGGRKRHVRGHVQLISCSNCGKCIPKNDSIKRYVIRNIVDKADLIDVEVSSTCQYYNSRFKYCTKVRYCVLCANTTAAKRRSDRRRMRMQNPNHPNLPTRFIRSSQGIDDLSGQTPPAGGDGAPPTPT